MDDVRCPTCDHGFNVWDHPNWQGECDFDVDCPNCGQECVVTPHVVEYEYEISAYP